MKLRPRFLAKFIARLTGYFWLPCPICGKEFAGFEFGGGVLYDSNTSGYAVCSDRACIAERTRRNLERKAAER